MTTTPFVPPAAGDLPEGVLESAVAGACALDARAGREYGRNVLAHALVRLQRDGWLNATPEQPTEQQLVDLRDPLVARLAESTDLRVDQLYAVADLLLPDLAELGRVRAELATAQAERGQLHSTLLHFAAEAHRRKWSHGTGDEGPTSPAFAELHRIGIEMAAAEHAVRRPAAHYEEPTP